MPKFSPLLKSTLQGWEKQEGISRYHVFTRKNIYWSVSVQQRWIAGATMLSLAQGHPRIRIHLPHSATAKPHPSEKRQRGTPLWPLDPAIHWASSCESEVGQSSLSIHMWHVLLLQYRLNLQQRDQRKMIWLKSKGLWKMFAIQLPTSLQLHFVLITCNLISVHNCAPNPGVATSLVIQVYLKTHWCKSAPKSTHHFNVCFTHACPNYKWLPSALRALLDPSNSWFTGNQARW